jgi:diaminopimelate epimerase
MDIIHAHGAGNTFVVLVDPDGTRRLSAELAAALCANGEGPAIDGAIRVAPGPAGTDVLMDHRNADGSSAAMCGNGVRVTALVALERGLVARDADALVVATNAGPRRVELRRGADGTFASAAVGMGRPEREPALVPFDASWARPDMGGRWHLEDVEVAFDVVSMGNPHAIVSVDDVESAPLETLGRDLASHPAFGEGVNVSFVHVAGRDRIRMRVLERGVGETAACGTGACAAVATLRDRGLVEDVVDVELPGGVLRITATDDGLVLEGPAEITAVVTLDASDVARLAGAAADGWALGPDGGADTP